MAKAIELNVTMVNGELKVINADSGKEYKVVSTNIPEVIDQMVKDAVAKAVPVVREFKNFTEAQTCEHCGKPITAARATLSHNTLGGKIVCMKCQLELGLEAKPTYAKKPVAPQQMKTIAVCADCGYEIKESSVVGFSQNKYGRVLCRECQSKQHQVKEAF